MVSDNMKGIQDQKLRRCCRVLAAVHELHKQGFQNLAIYPNISSSNWTLELRPYHNIAKDEDGNFSSIVSKDLEPAVYTSANSANHYFGWTDAASSTARELAAIMRERLPKLLARCEGNNFNYSGWLTYVIGEAEKGSLPIMSPASVDEISSTDDKSLLQPPHISLNRLNGREFVYVPAKYLTNNRDWHTSYVDIINELRIAEISMFPLYPVDTNDIFQIGAYWEGAIYYIQTILGYDRIDEFLKDLDSYSKTSETWSSFHAIWNNKGQLCYLKAFLIRSMLNSASRYELTTESRNAWKRTLNNFIRNHEEQNRGRESFYNPFFGGDNPLHLGLILHDQTNNPKLI